MRPPIILALLLLPGCAASDNLGKLPETATSGMYSTILPETLATCIAQAIDGTSQRQDGAYRITSRRRSDLVYVVAPNPRPGVYPTQVAVTSGIMDTPEGRKAANCLAQIDTPVPVAKVEIR